MRDRTITIAFTVTNVRDDVTDAELHDLLVDLLDEGCDSSSQGGRLSELTEPEVVQ